MENKDGVANKEELDWCLFGGYLRNTADSLLETCRSQEIIQNVQNTYTKKYIQFKENDYYEFQKVWTDFKLPTEWFEKSLKFRKDR